LLVNMGNRAYSESWANDFELAFGKLGGKTITRLEYPGGDSARFDDLAKQLANKNPDTVILITNAVDAAQLANQFVRMGSKTLLATSEWAGTGKLTDLGGRNVEGVVVPQYVDRFSTDPGYVKFREDYKTRFQQEPGFPAMMCYSATHVIFRGLRDQKPGESLKQTLLRIRQFDVLQGKITFDDFGDVDVATHLTEIQDGQYLRAQ
jgi:branched-chain amino acid transport system substrate-binding protein